MRFNRVRVPLVSLLCARPTRGCRASEDNASTAPAMERMPCARKHSPSACDCPMSTGDVGPFIIHERVWALVSLGIAEVSEFGEGREAARLPFMLFLYIYTRCFTGPQKCFVVFKIKIKRRLSNSKRLYIKITSSLTVGYRNRFIHSCSHRNV